MKQRVLLTHHVYLPSCCVNGWKKCLVRVEFSDGSERAGRHEGLGEFLPILCLGQGLS